MVDVVAIVVEDGLSRHVGTNVSILDLVYVAIDIDDHKVNLQDGIHDGLHDARQVQDGPIV